MMGILVDAKQTAVYRLGIPVDLPPNMYAPSIAPETAPPHHRGGWGMMCETGMHDRRTNGVKLP